MSDGIDIVSANVGVISSRNVIASALMPPRRPGDLSLLEPVRPANLPSADNPLPAVAYVSAPPVPMMNLQGQMIGSMISIRA